MWPRITAGSNSVSFCGEIMRNIPRYLCDVLLHGICVEMPIMYVGSQRSGDQPLGSFCTSRRLCSEFELHLDFFGCKSALLTAR